MILEPSYIDSKVAEWKRRGDSANTIKLRLNVLYQLMKFCRRRIDIEHFEEIEEICKEAKSETKIPEVPTRSEVELVLDGIYDYKYQLIIELMFFCGLRISEVLGLDLSDVRGNKLLIRSTKNNQDRLVPMPKNVIRTLRMYLQNERIVSDKYALLTTENGRLEKSVAQKMVKKYTKRAGLSDLHCHSFRHGSATHLLQKGVDVMVIKEFLGHQSITTTQRYAHVSAQMVNRVADVFEGKEE
jgi:site-specific recombinase XerD